MKNLILFCLLLAAGQSFAQLEKVFQEMENNDLEKAKSICDENISNGLDVEDSYIMKSLLLNLEDDPESFETFTKGIANKTDQDPYLYSLWFTNSVTAGYGKKSKDRLAYVTKLSNSPEHNYTIRGGAKYVLGHHFISANNFSTGRSMWGGINAITTWEFVGTFSNTSGSGFDKDYPPITKPNKTAQFVNQDQAQVFWFTPPEEEKDPWISFNNTFMDYEGVVYAQTFITNQEDRDVVLSLGGQGSFRVWINESEIITQEDELLTEMDNTRVKVHLPKGKHRVLMQVGFTSKSKYPNFLLRFLDENGAPISELNKSANISDSKYDNLEVKVLDEYEQFAVKYFKNKIEEEPKNIMNHILLAKCYKRSHETNDAIEILQEALTYYPNNVMVHYELMRAYQDIDDRTELLKQIEVIRNLNKDFMFLLYYDYGIAKSNKDVDEMSEMINKLEKKLGSNDATILEYKIELASMKQDYTNLTNLIERGYNLYRTDPFFVKLKYIIDKQSSPKGPPLKVLETYLKTNYDYSLNGYLMDEYEEAGKKDKAIKMLKKIHLAFPNELQYIEALLVNSFEQQDFYGAKNYCNKLIKQAPFRSISHLNRAYVNIALQNKDEAITDLKRTIELNPNSFEARERLREITDKQSLVTLIKNKNNEEIIKSKLKEEDESDFNYKFVFYEESHIQFQEGAGLTYTNIGIKILNESGIDYWKEASIPVNYNWENLTIVDALVYTKDGKRIDAERNYNQLVFPSLGVGDVIHIEYRKDKYTGGSFAEEFFLDYALSSSVPIENTSYKLITPKGYKYYEDHVNITEPAKEYEFDEFNCKEWSFDFIPAVDDEYYMPPISEVGKTLNVSTIEDWEEISEWYQDIAMPMAKEDFRLNQAYKEIFDGKEYNTDMEKHQAIYNYISDHIKYSSVSFRQSSFVPQKPMVTISTKLGDCKDMSLLYHTLAKKAGLTSNLVLVNTRNNGENELRLPSIAFNHCIVRIEVEEKPYFIELTDYMLPFGATPGTLENSQALIIPTGDTDKELGKDLIRIPNNHLIDNEIKRIIDITIEDETLDLSTHTTVSGYEAANYRSYFSDVTESEMKLMLKEYFADFFEEELEINSNEFYHLDEVQVPFEQKSEIKVIDNVKKMGSIKSLKVPFFEEILALDAFPNEERKFTYDYWDYENYDKYYTEVTIRVPEENEIVEVPEGISLKNDFIDYEIKVERIDDHTIKLIRIVSPKRRTFLPEEYELMRESAKKIVKAEDIYLVYK